MKENAIFSDNMSFSMVPHNVWNDKIDNRRDAYWTDISFQFQDWVSFHYRRNQIYVPYWMSSSNAIWSRTPLLKSIYNRKVLSVCLFVCNKNDHLAQWSVWKVGRFCLTVCLWRFCLFLPGWFFLGSRSFFMVFHGSRLVFHGSRSVFMVFHGSRLFFNGSRSVIMASHGPG